MYAFAACSFCTCITQIFYVYRFLDKLYMLSSAEALAQFMYNPSLYLLEPNPRVPCKLCVLGPPSSGKTSVANGIAKHFDAVVSELFVFYYC